MSHTVITPAKPTVCRQYHLQMTPLPHNVVFQSFNDGRTHTRKAAHVHCVIVRSAGWLADGHGTAKVFSRPPSAVRRPPSVVAASRRRGVAAPRMLDDCGRESVTVTRPARLTTTRSSLLATSNTRNVRWGRCSTANNRTSSPPRFADSLPTSVTQPMMHSVAAPGVL